ncbi:MAG: TlpA family protein disulfide reductase [Treponema sp.]|nr:TlpA family protein disulfide reductase [Treponema sp.]
MRIKFRDIVLCAVFFMLLPQYVNAQVSKEAAQLLRKAGIQVINQRTAPHNFTLQLLGGEKAALSSYRGKVVILNFWATWCPPCRAEMPSMETLYQRYNKQGLEILAVDLGEDSNTVQMFIQSNRYTFPVMLDSDSKVGNAFGITAIPTTYIIDREGKIIGRIVGSIHWDTPQVFAAFDALLNS